MDGERVQVRRRKGGGGSGGSGRRRRRGAGGGIKVVAVIVIAVHVYPLSFTPPETSISLAGVVLIIVVVVVLLLLLLLLLLVTTLLVVLSLPPLSIPPPSDISISLIRMPDHHPNSPSISVIMRTSSKNTMYSLDNRPSAPRAGE